jgi:hypothetical protein
MLPMPICAFSIEARAETPGLRCAQAGGFFDLSAGTGEPAFLAALLLPADVSRRLTRPDKGAGVAVAV